MQESETQQTDKKSLSITSKIKGIGGKLKVSKKVNLGIVTGKFLKFFSFIKSHKIASAGVSVVILLIVFVTVTKVTGNNPQAVVGGVTANSDQKIISVNRKFEVPIKTKDGTETGEKLGITITNVEKTPNILIQNKPAKTKEGKTFLVINIEIQNDTKKQLNVRPVDMVRLIGEDGRNYAPDVHNNEVPAEPVSLKKTRVGYVVDEGQNKFKLLIGEVRATQETIEIEF